MSRTNFFLSVIAVLLSNTSILAQSWEPAPPIPTGGAARTFAVGVNHQGTLYSVGGTPWQNGGDMDGAVDQLLPGATQWIAASPLSGMGPVLSQGAGVDSLGRIIVYGGFVDGDDGAGSDETYEPIDGPSGGIASRPAPSSAIGYMAGARDNLGRLYGIGGGPGEGGPNSGYCDRYDAATDSWETLAAMPTPAADACAAYDGAGHILVFGGINEAGSARLANVARYDIATNSWSDSATPDLPVALSGARAALGVDSRVYVAGGETGPLGNGITQGSVYKLEPGSNAWVQVESMSTPRKHFALVLGDDDYLYAIGGENDSGGTNLVEKRFTPRCPGFSIQPQDLATWSGTIAGFSVAVTGATPMTFEWRRDGTPLIDGSTGTGSTISGVDTAALRITAPNPSDEGLYECLVTNACGSTLSTAAMLTVRTTPTLPSDWTVINLHPAWADSSSTARGISNGRIGGEATTSTLMPDGRTLNLAHPVLWSGANLLAADLTPAGSVGGGVLDVSGDLFVGWFWHTYSCYAGGQWWTCAWRSAAYWSGESLEFTEAPHGSGPEYDSANGTDGQHFVGTLTYEYTEGNYSSYAYLWTPPAYGVSLHPAAGVSNSFAAAVDGDRQYGGIHTPFPAPVAHAAMWSGSAATFVDLHPSGYSRSWVNAAGDGQAVGTAALGDSHHAIIWAGSADAIVDLTPPGQTAEATDAMGGLQVGSLDGHAVIWAGAADSFVDLSVFLPAEYSGATAQGIEVAPDGTISVVGSAYVPTRSRSEAILWRFDPNSPANLGDMTCDGRVDGEDVGAFTLAVISPADYGTAHPGCDILNGDFNSSDVVDIGDLAAFVAMVLGQ
mgnify:CR=1 FL=1